MTLRPVNALRSMQTGTVSLSMTGDEVVIALARALTLDTTGYQVGSGLRVDAPLCYAQHILLESLLALVVATFILLQ
jgi:hypothetical protein